MTVEPESQKISKIVQMLQKLGMKAESHVF